MWQPDQDVIEEPHEAPSVLEEVCISQHRELFFLFTSLISSIPPHTLISTIDFIKFKSKRNARELL